MQVVVIMFFLSAFFSRCASISNPTGGPKDSLPPVIVVLEPDNYTTNFDTKKVYIEFDEFVVIKDQQKEFYTSPPMKSAPTIYTRGKGIVITIKDTLAENTTYSLNFGSSIRDNNEGNPLNAMRYVFSTGSTIDSMMVSGYTDDSYKADSVSKSFIYFFIADSLDAKIAVDSLGNKAQYDSTLFNYKPDVIARAENNGIFIAQNLKPIRYRVYAIEDTNGNQMYEPGTDKVGFLDQDIYPQELPGFSIWYDSIRQYPVADPQLYMRMFTDVAFKRQLLQNSARPEQRKAMLYFGSPNPKIESISFDSLSRDDVFIEPVTRNKDTLALWFKAPAEQLPDTIRTYVSYYKHDSIRNLVLSQDTLKLTWRLVESRSDEKKRLEKEAERDAALARGEEWTDPDVKFGYKMPLTGEVNPERHLSIDFDFPLMNIDTAKLLLTSMGADSVITDRPVFLERDSVSLRRYYIRSEWGSHLDKHTLIIPKGTFTDISGVSNDSLVGLYSISDPEKYATVLVKVVANEQKGAEYTLQLLDGKGKLLEEKNNISTEDVTFNYVPAGEIRLRVIEDMNGNGIWDTGNIVERRQAERSAMYSQDGEETFATKINWEVELSVDMNDLFVEPTMSSLMQQLEEQELQRIEKQKIKDAEDAAKKAQAQKSQGSGFGLSNITSQF